jgi:hypothetical protein
MLVSYRQRFYIYRFEKTIFSIDNCGFLLPGVHNGVAAKLKKKYGIDYLELNTCAAHTFALVGSYAGKELIG